MVRKRCVVCGDHYEAYNNKGKTTGLRIIKSKRPAKSLTCGRVCSKLYNGEIRRIYNQKYKTKKRLGILAKDLNSIEVTK